MNISARRITLLGVCLIAPLVAAVSLAWACVPTARVSVNPLSGPAGMLATMRGDGFPADTVTVEIYLDSRAGPLLKTVNASSSGADKAFSTELAMPGAVGAHLLIPVPRNSSGADIGNTGTNGAGPPAAVFQVTDPTLSVAPASGRPGSAVTVTGSAFKSGTVRLHWDSADGPLLGSATATGAGFGFSQQITVPAAAAVGNHSIVAVPFGDPSDSASASFGVTAPPPPLPGLSIPADTVGPAIAGAALTIGNGTRRASRQGVVSLFCGRYDETGVRGRCSAKSTRRLRIPGTKKSTLIKLSARSFAATPGTPVTVKLRLTKTARRVLKKAKKVGMRGTVSATDAKGNPTSVPFRFTLKPPR